MTRTSLILDDFEEHFAWEKKLLWVVARLPQRQWALLFSIRCVSFNLTVLRLLSSYAVVNSKHSFCLVVPVTLLLYCVGPPTVCTCFDKSVRVDDKSYACTGVFDCSNSSAWSLIRVGWLLLGRWASSMPPTRTSKYRPTTLRPTTGFPKQTSVCGLCFCIDGGLIIRVIKLIFYEFV